MEHPIGELMQTAMSSIRDMVDVNTVIGEPVLASSGATIIPISKVSFGYVTAGGDLTTQDKHAELPAFPFAGGSGAGVSVHPMGFLVCSANGVRMLSAGCASPVERIVELIPQALEGLRAMGEEDEPKTGRVRAVYQE